MFVVFNLSFLHEFVKYTLGLPHIAAFCPHSKSSVSCHLGATFPHISVSQNICSSASTQALVHLVCSLQPPCCCIISWTSPHPPLLFLSIPNPPPPLPPSTTPSLLKSAAIKTHAGLKCQKRISNCQNINLFTLRCLAFLRGEGGGGG